MSVGSSRARVLISWSRAMAASGDGVGLVDGAGEDDEVGVGAGGWRPGRRPCVLSMAVV